MPNSSTGAFVRPLCTCLIVWVTATPVWADELSSLQSDLKGIGKQVESAQSDAKQYQGGLAGTLAESRAQILKQTQALVEQKIIALKNGARLVFTLRVSKPDPKKAEQIEKDLLAAKEEVRAAEREASQYTGGLVQAMALSTVYARKMTVAMLEQGALSVRYGLAIPPMPVTGVTEQPESSSKKSPLTSTKQGVNFDAAKCVKLENFDSSILSENSVYTEVAWKADISSSCAQPLRVRVRFSLLDKDEFELDSDNADVVVNQGETGKARGKILLGPPEKAARMARNKVQYRVLP